MHVQMTQALHKNTENKPETKLNDDIEVVIATAYVSVLKRYNMSFATIIFLLFQSLLSCCQSCYCNIIYIHLLREQ